MNKIGDIYGCAADYRHLNEFVASLECEIEGVYKLSEKVANFENKPDGSLRNNGIEFVTRHPRTRRELIQEFETLHKNLTYREGADPFSERTSTHVHINVSSLTQEHVRNIVLLYALFEEYFFAMVKPERRNNIHCVPLTETHLPKIYHSSIDGLYNAWHKYTALNLKRMVDLGTLEFRHLHGTADSKEVDVWLHVLENLWKLGQRVRIDEQSLTDKKTIEEWFELLFFPADRIMAMKASLFDIIKNNLIDVKFSTITH